MREGVKRRGKNEQKEKERDPQFIQGKATGLCSESTMTYRWF